MEYRFTTSAAVEKMILARRRPIFSFGAPDQPRDNHGKWTASDEALANHGETKDPFEAGYVVPNGKMVDMSHRNDKSYPGERALDHRDVKITPVELESPITTMKKSGAIRVAHEYGSYDFGSKPLTSQQKDVMKGMFDHHNGQVYIDVDSPNGVKGASYPKGTSSDKLFAHIARHQMGLKVLSAIHNNLLWFYAPDQDRDDHGRFTGPGTLKEAKNNIQIHGNLQGKRKPFVRMTGASAKAFSNKLIPERMLKYLTGPDQQKLVAHIKNGDIEKLANKLVEEHDLSWSHDPKIMAAKEWYSQLDEKMSKAFGVDKEFVTNLIACTSPQEGPIQNWKNAIDAYDRYKHGDFKAQIEAYEAQGCKGEITEEMKPKFATGMKYGINSDPVLRVLSKSWNPQGPKVPNFKENILGTGHEATIDRWAGRTLQRLTGGGYVTKDPSVSNLDFMIGQLAFRAAADKISESSGTKMQPDELQAIAWYGEQDYYTQKGILKSDPESYMPQLDARIAEKRDVKYSAIVPTDISMFTDLDKAYISTMFRSCMEDDEGGETIFPADAKFWLTKLVSTVYFAFTPDEARAFGLPDRLQFYSPDQERSPDGKWSGSGSTRDPYSRIASAAAKDAISKVGGGAGGREAAVLKDLDDKLAADKDAHSGTSEAHLRAQRDRADAVAAIQTNVPNALALLQTKGPTPLEGDHLYKNGFAFTETADAQREALIGSAKANGLLVPSPFAEVKPDFIGGEHNILFEGDAVIRESKEFGLTYNNDTTGMRSALPQEYLERLDLCNKLFNVNTKVMGVTDQGNIVTSTPYIKVSMVGSSHPTDDEFAKYLKDKGFTPAPYQDGTNFYNPKTNIQLIDCVRRNFMLDDQHKIHAVDVIPTRLPTAKEKADTPFVQESESVQDERNSRLEEKWQIRADASAAAKANKGKYDTRNESTANTDSRRQEEHTGHDRRGVASYLREIRDSRNSRLEFYAPGQGHDEKGQWESGSQKLVATITKVPTTEAADIMAAFRGSGSTAFKDELARQKTDLIDGAKKLGLLGNSPFYKLDSDFMGGEHVVNFGDKLVTRETIEGKYGFTFSGMTNELRAALPNEYLDRVTMLNKVFPEQPITVTGITNRGCIVTTTPLIESGTLVKGNDDAPPGIHPDSDKVAGFLTSKGFLPIRGSGTNGEFFNPRLGIRLSDCDPKNFLTDNDGKIHAVDVIPSRVPIKIQPANRVERDAENDKDKAWGRERRKMIIDQGVRVFTRLRVLGDTLAEFYSPDQTRDAHGEWSGGSTDRYQLGLTTYQNAHSSPDVFEAGRQRIEDAISKTPGVINARVHPSQGMYGGSTEKSYDAEFTVPKGTNIEHINELVKKLAAENHQEAAFVTRATNDKAAGRPLLEIAFKHPITDAEAIKLAADFSKHGLGGFTEAKDNLGNTVGVRTQSTPEFGGPAHGEWASHAKTMMAGTDRTNIARATTRYADTKIYQQGRDY